MSRVFSGTTGDYLSTTDAGVTISAYPMSMVAWVLSDVNSNQLVELTGTTSGALIRLMTTARMSCDDSTASTTVTPPATGTGWYLYIGTVAEGASGVTIDADGTTGSAGTVSALTAIVAPKFSIGARGGTGGDAHDGKIAHVALYDKVLTGTDVTELKAGTAPDGLTSGTSNLVEYWALTTSSLTGVNGAVLSVNGTVTNDDADNPSVTPASSTTATRNITVNDETGYTVIQTMTAVANTTDDESMFGSTWITTENNMQARFKTVSAGGMTITADVSGDGTFTTSENTTEVIPLWFYSPAYTEWSKINFTITAAASLAAALSLPTEASITAATATVGITTDDALGTLYYYISTSATAPSATDLKAGTSSVTFGSDASLSVGINTFAATGLSASTTYYTYFLQANGTEDSTIAESGSWVTIAPVLSLPTETLVSDTNLTVSATSDSTTGTMYYYVSTSATPPSAANLKDGTSSVKFGNATGLGIGITSFAVTGLTASTTYYTYFIQNDGTADSNLLESGSWATTAIPVTFGTSVPSTRSRLNLYRQ